jgi:hypothetical protein
MSHLTDKMLNRILKDGAILLDPKLIKEENRKKAVSSGKLCRKGKCFYAKFCGEHKDPVTCEMFRPPRKKPSTKNRELFNGRK